MGGVFRAVHAVDRDRKKSRNAEKATVCRWESLPMANEGAQAFYVCRSDIRSS
jgi:hypothetical protein